MPASAPLKFGHYDYAGFIGFISYACCALLLSMVLPPVSQSLGFPLSDGNQGLGGALHLCRSVMMFCVMMGSAFIAGRFGKRLYAGASLLLMGGGIFLAGFSRNYLQLLAAIGISAIGQGGFEVLITPIVQSLHTQEDSSRYVNITHAFWSAGVLIMVLITGTLLNHGICWRNIMAITGLLTLVPGAMFLIPGHRQNFPPTVSLPRHKIVSRLRSILCQPHFWLFMGAMFLAGGAEHCLLFWLPAYIQQTLHIPGLLSGLGTGCFAAGMITGRLASGVWGSGGRMHRIIVVSAMTSALLGFVPLFLTSLPLLYILLFVFGLTTGPLWPSIQNRCVERIRGDITTMLLLLPAIGIPGCGFFTWFMGWCGDIVGFRNSFLVIPACHLMLMFLMIYEEHHRTSMADMAPHAMQPNEMSRPF